MTIQLLLCWVLPPGPVQYCSPDSCVVDKLTYPGSSVSSTETDTDIDTQLTKAWTAINRLLVIWKSDLTDKIKLFLLNSDRVDTAIWMLTKRLEKKLDGNNYTPIIITQIDKDKIEIEE